MEAIRRIFLSFFLFVSEIESVPKCGDHSLPLLTNKTEPEVMSISKKQVTMMKLKVDLDCAKCYKKVKKVLCKFPREFLLSLFYKDSGELLFVRYDSIGDEMDWVDNDLCDWEQEKSEIKYLMKSPT